MKKRCGLSVSIWLWTAVMAMPLSRRARITGVHLISDQDEIPGDRRLATTCRLEVDRCCESHGRRHLNPVGRYRFRARYAHLVHAAVHPAMKSEYLPDLSGVDAQARRGRRRGSCAERCAR